MVNRTQWPYLGGVLSLIVVILLAACGANGEDASVGDGNEAPTGGSSPTGATQEDLTLRIGWANDLTGSTAVYGIEESNAARLAVKHVNESGGAVQVELVEQDTQSTTEGAVSATQRLVADGDLHAFSGYAFTPSGQAAAPLLLEDGRPTLMVSTTVIPEPHENIFTVNRANGELQDSLVSEYLAPAGMERLAIIWQEHPTLNDNREHLISAAESAGIEIVADRGTSLGTEDFSTQIAAVLDADPDVVSLQAITTAVGNITADLRARGYEGEIVSQLGAVAPQLPEVAGDAVNGMVVPTFWVPGVDNEMSTRFVEEYQAEYPDAPAPTLYGMEAYDAIRTLAQAAEQAGSTDTSALIEALGAGEFEAGMTNPLTFDDQGYAVLDHRFIRYDDLEPQLFKP